MKMNIGDIWGAKETPEPVEGSGLIDKLALYESMTYIHSTIQWIKSLNEGWGTTFDEQRIKNAFTVLNSSCWRAICALDLTYFYKRPMNAKRVFKVSSRLMNLNRQEIVNCLEGKGTIFDEPV